MCVQRTIVRSLRIHCCRSKAVSVKYCECVCILALFIRHAKRMRRIVLLSLVCLSVWLYSMLPHYLKWHYFRGNKIIEHVSFDFLYRFCLKRF